MPCLEASTAWTIPPKAYGPPKGQFYKGLIELDRCELTMSSQDKVFEEHLGNKSMQASRHRAALSKSSGLEEWHHDTMRKAEQRMKSLTSGPPFTDHMRRQGATVDSFPGRSRISSLERHGREVMEKESALEEDPVTLPNQEVSSSWL